MIYNDSMKSYRDLPMVRMTNTGMLNGTTPREEMIAFGWMDEAGKINDRFKSTEQGAATSLWAALAPELEGIGGLYLEDCAQAAAWSQDDPVHGVMPHALDPEAAERLWDLSVKTTGADL